MTYSSPLSEQLFVLDTIADLHGLADLGKFGSFDKDLVEAILIEGGRLASDVFAPLNRKGDIEGARWSDGAVTLPDGFRNAYDAYVAGGWGSLCGSPGIGGQGLPYVLSVAVNEQLTAANMGMSLCPILTAGAVEAIAKHGSDAQKRIYLPKLLSGEWTGTMNLTEPQAGSDVGALKTIATPTEDGSWRINGSKIFISWGEHDLAENIIHLVLARTPGAPPGTKGLSLFVVPKFIVGDDGSLWPRNDLHCVSIEHKLGIHASPTCSISFGDNGQCIGWLVGEVNGGMAAMFTMMNHTRINVALQGVGIAERAYQGALAYAKERIQSALIPGGPPVRIIEHPDVRRMLLTMKVTTQAIRALTYYTASLVDRAHAEPSPLARAAAADRAALLTPVAKAYSTEMGVDVANLGIQIFGGMGFIEETGAAQHLRDARIAPIYEGTNGIQALDLVRRKLLADGGQAWKALFAEIGVFLRVLPEGGDLGAIRQKLDRALAHLTDASHTLVSGGEVKRVAVATPYARMVALVVSAYLMARQAWTAALRIEEGTGDATFLQAKILSARFYSDEILPQAAAYYESIADGSADKLFAISEDALAS